MKPKLLVIFLFAALVLLFTIAPTSAQSDLDETYVAEDSTFQISYPSDWDINDDDEPAYIILSGIENRERISVTVFSTETVALFSIGESAAVDVAANVAEVFDFVQDDAEEFDIEGRDVGLASVDLDGQTGAAFIIEMRNGDYGMVIVLGDDEALEDNVDFIVSMVASYNTPTGTGKGQPDLGGNDSDVAESLSNHDGDWEDAIAELQDLGLIGTGGSLVFEEDSAFFTGQGFFFTPLGRRAPFADIVMAGQIEFTSGSASEYEECSLLARVVDEGQSQVGTYLQVGVDNSQDVFYYDTISSDEDSTVYEPFRANLDLDEAHHFLFILVDESLTVYIDGELLVENAEINDERAGTYGIALMGSSRDSRCEGTNLWVYQVPSFEAGVCEVSAGGSVNKRSGPGTNFDRAGTLEAGTIMEVIGQSTASDGFVWWELEDGSWVRDDIVNAVGDCASVPESE
jgi:hypothetical protein